MRRLGFYVVTAISSLALLMFILIDAGTELLFILRNHWEILNPFLQIKVIVSLLINPFWWAAVIVGGLAHTAAEKLDPGSVTETVTTSSSASDAQQVTDFDDDEPLTYDEELMDYQRELARTRRSNGHVTFSGNIEYFIRTDGLYASLLTNPIDATGQRSNASMVCPNSEMKSVLNLLSVRDW